MNHGKNTFCDAISQKQEKKIHFTQETINMNYGKNILKKQLNKTQNTSVLRVQNV